MLTLTTVSIYIFTDTNASAKSKIEPRSPGLNASINEQKRFKEEYINWLKDEGHYIQVAGPETRGSEIKVANKKVKLPDDAYLEGLVVSVLYPEGEIGTNNDDLPAYAIVRGDTKFFVSERTGKIMDIQGRELQKNGQFEFLD